MIYPTTFEQKTGFSEIRSLLKNHCRQPSHSSKLLARRTLMPSLSHPAANVSLLHLPRCIYLVRKDNTIIKISKRLSRKLEYLTQNMPLTMQLKDNHHLNQDFCAICEGTII